MLLRSSFVLSASLSSANCITFEDESSTFMSRRCNLGSGKGCGFATCPRFNTTGKCSISSGYGAFQPVSTVGWPVIA